MLLLLTFQEESKEEVNKETLRAYQRESWGMLNGETCVIELFGLPAPNFKKYKERMLTLFTPKEIDEILQDRIDFIRACSH